MKSLIQLNNRLKKLWPIIFIFFIYYTAFQTIKLEEVSMILYIIYCLVNEKIIKFKVNVKLVIILIVVSIVSIIQANLNDFLTSRVFEQIIIIWVMFIGYSKLFEKYGYLKLFKRYMSITYFISIMGIIQFIVFFLVKKDIFPYPIGSNINGLPVIANRIIRIRSIAFEPGWLAQTMLPGVLFSIESLIKNKKFNLKFFTIILVFAFTLSSGAFIVVPIYFVITRLKKANMKKMITIFPLVIISILLTKPIWYEKYTETLKGLSGLKTGFFKDINASSFATLSNLYVGLNNNNLLLGTGLGTHTYSYFKNFKNYHAGVYHFYGLNSKDAYSLFTRSLSEMGLIFILLFTVVLILKINKNKDIKAIINNCFFVGIISFFLRGGLYTRFGTSFIIMMFFYTIEKNKKRR
ncbi:MAG: hypothetical protein ACRC5T_08290 [Cetobacterium sp.]